MSLLIIILLAACSAAPPTEPTTGFVPYTAPLAPTNVTATNGESDSIEITWDEVEGATSYQVWAIKAEDYGTASRSTSTNETYSSLMARGFELVDVVTDTEYKLKGESTNSSYVFSIVAMKAMETFSHGATVLYSEPSDFVQGGTVGEIILSVVANSKIVSLYWDISNIYSVINNDEAKDSLYSYRLSVFKKKTADDEWDEGEIIETGIASTQSFTYQATSLDIDTQYDFKLLLEVLDSDNNVINSVESDEYTVTTDSAIVPESITEISADSGEKKNEVTVSWKEPVLPHGDEVSAIYQIERSSNGGASWTDLGETTGTTYTDSTIENNRVYTYRIVSGYRIGEKSPVYQPETDATEIKDVYSMWMPDKVSFSFEESASSNRNGTLTVKFRYNPPYTSDKLFCTVTEDWLQEDLTTKGTDSRNFELDTEETGEYTLTWDISIEDTQPLTFLTFTFNFLLSESDSYTEKAPVDFSLGESNAKDLISGVTATDNWVGMIRLSWTENSAHKDDYTYTIIENSNEVTCLEVKTDESDSLKKYVDIPVTEDLKHTYRIKVVSTAEEFDSEEATGTILAKPEGLSATDSTSIENIIITWPTESDSSVRYILKYQYSDESTWSEVDSSKIEYDSTANIAKATFDALKDGTDGKKVTFVLHAYNAAQPGFPEITSEEETGSVFGPALLNVRINNNGEDPEKISIEWDAIDGAASYTIYRNTVELKTLKKTAYEDNVDAIKNVGANEGDDDYMSPTDDSYVPPMNRTYTYTVVPNLEDETAAVVTASSTSAKADGKLFAPPANISATKGEREIVLKWDAVDKAKSYEIARYVVNVKNGEVEKSTPVDDLENDDTLKNTTECTYTELQQDLLNSSIMYEVRSVMEKEDGTVVRSEWQTGYGKRKNVLGFYENNNIGYKIQNVPELIILPTDVDANGYYKDYIKIRWYASSGATSYTITCYTSSFSSTETKVNSVEVKTDELKYKESEVTDNGVSGKGYLSYDPEFGLYTYYLGDLNAYMIDSCVIIANNSAARSGEKNNNSIVYRQPSAEEWVSILMSVLKPAFTAANTSFSGDWWIDNANAFKSPSDSFTYGTTGMTFNLYTNSISANYPYAKNYLTISDYTDETNSIKISTTENIQFDASEGGVGNQGTNPLKLIGYDGNGYISITPIDTKIKAVTIKLKNISAKDVDASGNYTVTIDGSDSVTINDDSKFDRVL